MALNCATCDHKKNVATNGHCAEFVHIPDLDQCDMHSKGVRAQAVQVVKSKRTGSYLWLSEGKAEQVNQPTV